MKNFSLLHKEMEHCSMLRVTLEVRSISILVSDSTEKRASVPEKILNRHLILGYISWRKTRAQEGFKKIAEMRVAVSALTAHWRCRGKIKLWVKALKFLIQFRDRTVWWFYIKMEFWTKKQIVRKYCRFSLHAQYSACRLRITFHWKFPQCFQWNRCYAMHLSGSSQRRTKYSFSSSMLQ